MIIDFALSTATRAASDLGCTVKRFDRFTEITKTRHGKFPIVVVLSRVDESTMRVNIDGTVSYHSLSTFHDIISVLKLLNVFDQ